MSGNRLHSYTYFTIVISKHLFPQIRAFMQLGKNAGKSSISVAVDVATNMMMQKGITPKFTLDELRDNITQYNCGTRGQSRRFHQLDRELNWHGSTVALKVPVIHLSVFPEDVQQALINTVSNQSPSTGSSLISGTTSGTLSLAGTTDRNATLAPMDIGTGGGISSPMVIDTDTNPTPNTGDVPPPTDTNPTPNTGDVPPPTDIDPTANTGDVLPPTNINPPANNGDVHPPADINPPPNTGDVPPPTDIDPTANTGDVLPPTNINPPANNGDVHPPADINPPPNTGDVHPPADFNPPPSKTGNVSSPIHSDPPPANTRNSSNPSPKDANGNAGKGECGGGARRARKRAADSLFDSLHQGFQPCRSRKQSEIQ